MDGRKSGKGRGRGIRQPQTQGDDQESSIGPSQGQVNEEDNQVATVINCMTDILERLAEHQGLEPVNQLRAQERGEDRVLERFFKFTLFKFLGSPLIPK